METSAAQRPVPPRRIEARYGSAGGRRAAGAWKFLAFVTACIVVLALVLAFLAG